MRSNSTSRIAISLGVVLLSAQAALAAAPVHSVVGSGTVSEGPVTFRQTVAVHGGAGGDLSGTAVVVLDLTALDLGKITFKIQPTCLDVDGNSAWIGGVVTHSTNEQIIPVGEGVIVLVRDLGGNGQDIVHAEFSEFFPPGTQCTDRPALPETVVENGNFKVR